MLEPAVHQGALHDLRVTQHVVVAAGDDAYDGGPRLDLHPGKSRHRQRARGLGDDALVLIQRQHLGAHRALVRAQKVRAPLVVLDHLERERADALDRRTVDERVNVRQRHRTPVLERCGERRRAARFHPHHGRARRHVCHVRHDPAEQAAAADGHHDGVQFPAKPRQLCEDLGGNRALPDDGIAGVERLDDCCPALAGVGTSRLRRLVERIARHDELDVVAAVDHNPIALLLRCGLGHEDLALDP